MISRVLLSALVLMAAASCGKGLHQADDRGCPSVAEIKTMPFHDERGVDAAYDRLRFDAACEAVLIEALDNTQKMPDPRQMPTDARFAVSDAALFILMERRSLEIEQVLPDDVAARLKDRGIYAYFDYVARPAGRTAVVDRLRQPVRK